MEKQNYHSSITVNTDAKKVFENISRVSSWWAAGFEGQAKNPGELFTVRFGETFVSFRIVETIPGKKIVWQVIDCNLHWLSDKKEWNHTKINWDISQRGDKTQIDFTHIGLVPGIECYNDCKKGWDFFIQESLFKLITEGKGLPEVPKTARESVS
jgi:hypothetical protein